MLWRNSLFLIIRIPSFGGRCVLTFAFDLHNFNKQVYQVAYVVVKSAISPRPGNWILERSIDGDTFLPWQYYAISEAECLSR